MATVKSILKNRVTDSSRDTSSRDGGHAAADQVSYRRPAIPEVKGDYVGRRDHFCSVKFIFECGVKLERKDTTICCAAMYYHRFFQTAKLSDYDPYLIGSACLYMASKAQEDAVPPRDVVNVAHNTLHPEAEVLSLDGEYWVHKDSLAEAELLILRMLKFDVLSDLAQKYMLHYLHDIDAWVGGQVWNDVPVPKLAWTMLQDYHFSPNIIKHKPQHIALAMIYFALHAYGREIPLEGSSTPWYEAMCPDAKREAFWEIIDELLETYEKDMSLYPKERGSSAQ